MTNPKDLESMALETLISHEPTRDPSGALSEVERATGLRDTVATRRLLDDLVRRGLVRREPIVTHSFSSDDQRWCWKKGPF
jgi:hypothetical protein